MKYTIKTKDGRYWTGDSWVASAKYAKKADKATTKQVYNSFIKLVKQEYGLYISPVEGGR